MDALYPNPTTGIFFITFSKALQNAKIKVMDVNGNTILNSTSSGTKLTMDLSRFAPGTYFIRIQEDGKMISKKIIKQ